MRGGGHGGDHGERIIDGPLSAGLYRRREVPRPAVDIVAPKHVGDEHAMELAGFELLGEVDPVLDGVKLVRAVVRVSP